ATGGVNFQTGSADFQINDRSVWQPANVIMVAQSGGDYTSVQAAIDSITDAAADNPYLVWVAPGVYNETVTMKPYVHLQGAGQEATVITSTATTGAWPPDTGTLVLTDHVSLRDLTVGNSGTGSRNVALLAMDGTTQTLVTDVTARVQGAGISNNYASFLTGSGTGVTLSDVTALAENGGSNYGLYNYNGAAATLHGGSFTGHRGSSNNYGLYNDHGAATLRGGSFTGRGGNDARGIYNRYSGTTLEAENVTGLGENASNFNSGLCNSSAAATLRGGSFTGRGGSNAYGVHNDGSSATLEAESVTALAENATNSNVGLYNFLSAAATLYGGSFTGCEGHYTRGIYNSATLSAESVTGLAENGDTNNYGLYNEGAGAAILRGGSFIGRGDGDARGIYNSYSGTTLQADSVTGLGENGTNNYGLYNCSAATATLRGGSFTANGGSNAYGIYNDDAGTTLEAESIAALGENGTSSNYGLYNANGAAATPRGGSFTARGGSCARGIYNDDAGTTLEAESIAGLGENGTSSNYGLYNASSAAAILRDGSFTGRGGDNAYGIYNDGASTTLETGGIAALGENSSTFNYGLYNFFGTATLRGGSFIGRGGSSARGIVNYGSGATLEAERVSVLAENGFANNYGLYNPSGAATLRGGSCIGRGGVAYGIYNIGSSATLDTENLTALGENGNTNYGLRITAGTATVTQGVLEGVTYSVVHNGGAITISNSRLVGGAVSGSVTCVAVSRGATWSQNTCP
ncbi:MAG: hypothetical protein J7M17_04005, partial [Anaerolineae bacterium]|nr:hypothetical protein [Anaerolineae bacterium]